MYKRFMPLLLLFSGNVMAFEFPIEVTEYFDNIRIAAYIKKTDINENIHWIPFKSAPPLSIEDALKAVQKYISTDTVFTDTHLTEIELKRIPHHETHWHYLVRARYKVNGETKPHFFIVLMDGKVISAIKEPDSIK